METLEAQRARKLYLRSLRQLAYEHETAKTPRKIDALRPHGPFAQAIAATTPLRESDAFAAAASILASSDPLKAFNEAAKNLPVSVLNFLLSQHDMAYFAKRYMPHVFDVPFSKHLHGRLFPLLYDITHSITVTPSVIAGWRECGKSVCTAQLAPLHSTIFPAKLYLPDGRVINRSKEYVMLISLVKGGARKALRAIQFEFESNEAIRADFGEFYYVNGHKPELWNKSEFLTSNGVYFESMSRFTSLRGARERHRRPDFPIVDDVEDVRLSQNSPDRRQADLEWFTQEFIPAVSTSKGTPVMLGNYAYKGCMAMRLAELGKINGWNVLVFKLKDIIDGVEQYTWAEKFGPEFERKKKNDLVFESAWQTEYMLNPGAAGAEITESDFKGYSLDWFMRERLKYCRIYIACDPACGTSSSADKTAIVSLALDKANGNKYVLPIVNERGLGVDEIVKRFIAQYLKYHPRVRRTGIEAVGFQRTLKANIDSECKKQGLSIDCHALQQGSRLDKRGRIRRTWPSIKRGDVYFLLEDADHKEMIAQILNENSDHDDAADAFEMADRLILDEAADAAKNQQHGHVRVRTLHKDLRKGKSSDDGKQGTEKRRTAM